MAKKRLSPKIAFEMGEAAAAGVALLLVAIIGGVIWYINAQNTVEIAEPTPAEEVVIEPIESVDASAIRYVLGEGQITWVEYGDLECPLCKRFHPTAQKVRSEFSDRIAYTFKHFPTGAYERSVVEAGAAECVGAQDADAYFTFIDRVFEVTPSNDGLTQERLLELVEETGVEMETFMTCWENEQYSELLEADSTEARASGATGTPHNVFLDADGNIITTVAGGLSEIQLRETLDGLLD